MGHRSPEKMRVSGCERSCGEQASPLATARGSPNRRMRITASATLFGDFSFEPEARGQARK